MNPDTQNQNNKFALTQKIDTVLLVSLFPALTLMVFLRKELGFRLLKPNTLLLMAVIMITAAIFCPLGGKSALIIYAVLMVLAGLFQRIRHWRSIKMRKGQRHTRATGISYFDADWMLPFFLEERRVYRFFDPLLCVLIGFVFSWLKAQALGLWVMIGALALFFFECGYYERALNRFLDIYDGMIEAATQQAIATSLSRKPKAARQLLKDRGLPSGIGTDIIPLIEEMKAAQSANQVEVPAPSLPAGSPVPVAGEVAK